MRTLVCKSNYFNLVHHNIFCYIRHENIRTELRYIFVFVYFEALNINTGQTIVVAATKKLFHTYNIFLNVFYWINVPKV